MKDLVPNCTALLLIRKHPQPNQIVNSPEVCPYFCVPAYPSIYIEIGERQRIIFTYAQVVNLIYIYIYTHI